MELVLRLALVDAGPDLIERPLHRGLGVVPRAAAGGRGLADRGVELVDFALDGVVDLVAALLQLRAIRLERRRCGLLEPLDSGGELFQ